MKSSVSDRKRRANRANAQKSTGPRSPEGKRRSSRNALKHGLLAREVLVVGECREDLAGLARRLHGQLCPVGELEQLLVDRIVASLWRLRRCLRQETAAIEHERKETSNDDDTEEMRRDRDAGVAFRRQYLEPLARYETALERQVYRALNTLERLQAARAGPPPAPSAVIAAPPGRPALPFSPQSDEKAP